MSTQHQTNIAEKLMERILTEVKKVGEILEKKYNMEEGEIVKVFLALQKQPLATFLNGVSTPEGAYKKFETKEGDSKAEDSKAEEPKKEESESESESEEEELPKGSFYARKGLTISLKDYKYWFLDEEDEDEEDEDEYIEDCINFTTSSKPECGYTYTSVWLIKDYKDDYTPFIFKDINTSSPMAMFECQFECQYDDDDEPEIMTKEEILSLVYSKYKEDLYEIVGEEDEETENKTEIKEGSEIRWKLNYLEEGDHDSPMIIAIYKAYKYFKLPEDLRKGWEVDCQVDGDVWSHELVENYEVKWNTMYIKYKDGRKVEYECFTESEPDYKWADAYKYQE